MKNRRSLKGGLAACAALAGLAGCQDFEAAHDRAEDAYRQASSRHVPDAPVVSSTSEPLIVGEAIPQQPDQDEALGRSVTLVIARKPSLPELASILQQQTSIPVEVEPDAATDIGGDIPPPVFDGNHLPPPPSAFLARAAAQQAADYPSGPGPWLRYSGSRQGLFDIVATRYGVFERYEDRKVVFFRTETKTFSIPALFFTTKNTSQIASTTGASTSSGGGGGGIGGGGGGGGSLGGGGGGSANGNTQIALESEENPWKNLQKTAEVISGGASIIADPQLGTVTVTGSPIQVGHVAEWVSGLNATLMKQVAVTIHIYSVKQNREQNYAWKPELAVKNYGKVYGLAMMPAAAPAIESAATPFSFGASILNTATGAAGQFSGSQAVAEALATNGDVTDTYEHSAVTTNGVPAPFQRGTQTGYLQSASSVLATNAGVSNSLQPGTVTSGFTGMITPRIAGDGRILLRLDLDLQTLLGIQTISSGGSSIQVPTTSNTTLHQSTVLQPGSTLVLTGYANDNSSATRNGVGDARNWLLGGGGDAQLNKQLIVITVEARVI